MSYLRVRGGPNLVFLTCLTALTATVAVALSEPAGAEPPSGTVVVQSGPHGQVRTAAPWVRDKDSLLRSVIGGTAAPDAPPVPLVNWNQSLEPSGVDTITPPGGDPDEITASGASFVEVPFFEFSANFTDNTSRVAWLGFNPFNADSVTQTDNWHVDTFGFSVTVANPPSGSVSQSEGDLQWPTTVEDNWFSEHSWDSVEFTAGPLGSIYRIRFNVTGAFQFGSSFFAVTGRDSALV